MVTLELLENIINSHSANGLNPSSDRIS